MGRAKCRCETLPADFSVGIGHARACPASRPRTTVDIIDVICGYVRLRTDGRYEVADHEKADLEYGCALLMAGKDAE